MVQCAVPFCTNRADNRNLKNTAAKWVKHSFHKLPKSRFMRERWVKILNIDLSKRKSPDELKICSDHFSKECFKTIGNRCKLKLDAFPSGTVENVHLQQTNDYQGTIKCSAYNCDTELGDTDPRFRLPKDDQLQKQWLKNMKMENRNLGSNPVLCMKHFRPEYIMLHPKAVPTIFNQHPRPVTPNFEQACAVPTPNFPIKTEIKESMCLYSLNPTVIIKEENIFIKSEPLECKEKDPLNV